jgi:NAD(P)-dependent dehydrogenase (short-subunit alcohol dehydrogenase family)
MKPSPLFKPQERSYKLAGQVALITGGDSGIGRAVALAFVQEGADIMISYLNEHNRAWRIIDQLEASGIVGPFDGSKAREVKLAND